MKEKLFITNEILINTNSNLVWDVLTKPEYTSVYMFGCETVSDWKVDSSLEWKMNYEGKDIVAVKGVISSIEVGEFLAYTTFDPNSTMEDIPENHLTVTYNLKALGDSTILTVTQGDYNIVADGERRFKEAQNNGEGWMPILKEMKKLAESL